MKHSIRLQAMERYIGLLMTAIGHFLFILLFARFFIISPGTVDGPSMEPTFIDDDTLWISKSAYLFHAPERFDIVQFISPYRDKHIVKRVIGLPGETIIIKRGKTYIVPRDGEEYELDESEYLEPYTFTKIHGQTGVASFDLKEHEYFLMGDNRPASSDSRSIGPVHRSFIVGKSFGKK